MQEVTNMDWSWTQIVTWLIVISGWWLVNRQNNIREKRKEIRALIDKVLFLIDEIEQQAIHYHTKAEMSDEIAFQLKRGLHQKLRDKLKILNLREINTDSCSQPLKELRQAITLKNFDTTSFAQQNLSSNIITNIWFARDKLSQEVEKCFLKTYDK